MGIRFGKEAILLPEQHKCKPLLIPRPILPISNRTTTRRNGTPPAFVNRNDLHLLIANDLQLGQHLVRGAAVDVKIKS
jgi:hypothetical protein